MRPGGKAPSTVCWYKRLSFMGKQKITVLEGNLHLRGAGFMFACVLCEESCMQK